MMLIGIYVTEYCNAVERIKEKNETLFNLDPPLQFWNQRPRGDSDEW